MKVKKYIVFNKERSVNKLTNCISTLWVKLATAGSLLTFLVLFPAGCENEQVLQKPRVFPDIDHAHGIILAIDKSLDERIKRNEFMINQYLYNLERRKSE